MEMSEIPTLPWETVAVDIFERHTLPGPGRPPQLLLRDRKTTESLIETAHTCLFRRVCSLRIPQNPELRQRPLIHSTRVQAGNERGKSADGIQKSLPLTGQRHRGTSDQRGQKTPAEIHIRLSRLLQSIVKLDKRPEIVTSDLQRSD